MKPQTLKAMHAEWRKLSAGLACEPAEGETQKQAERSVRLDWTNVKLKKPQGFFTSWNQLTEGQARRLIKLMREESGDGARYRAMRIAELACELWGGRQWDDFLCTCLGERFHVGDPRELSPDQAHIIMEELQSRIARRDGLTIEDVRKRFSKKVSGARCQVPGSTNKITPESPDVAV
jgi:hypothetical protein